MNKAEAVVTQNTDAKDTKQEDIVEDLFECMIRIATATMTSRKFWRSCGKYKHALENDFIWKLANKARQKVRDLDYAIDDPGSRDYSRLYKDFETLNQLCYDNLTREDQSKLQEIVYELGNRKY